MRYSRLAQTEERKNKRKAVIYIVLAVSIIVLLVTLGIPLTIRMTSIVTDFRESNEPIEQDDTTPPAPPQLDPLPDATNNERLEIKGTSEPGSTVVLFLNDEKNEVVVNDKGEFLYTYTLGMGDNTITVLTRDATGNESSKSRQYIVIYDNEPPEITINSPPEGEKYYGLKERQITIDGTTEPNADVTINDRFVAVDADGTFAYATTLKEGDNEFKIKVVDNAGNSTEKVIKVSYSE